MAISDRSVLCVYRYDPLDRLADCSPAGQGSARFFYQKNRLATQIQGQIQHRLLRTDEYLLAQRRTENNQSDSALLATDQQQSVIAARGLALAYTPYGYRQPSAGPTNLPGFTGERVDPVTGHYLLGNGYRAFNPVLMRFNSPDSLSPFGEGGLNAYGYCEGDPVNRVDPSGHMFKALMKKLKAKSGDRQRLIGKSTSNESLVSLVVTPAGSSMPTQAASPASDVVSLSLSGSGVVDNSLFDGTPRLPPRNARSRVIPPQPPRPPRSQLSSHVPAPDSKQWYVMIEGEKVGINKAIREHNTLIKASESYIREGKPVPYAMSYNRDFYGRLVKYLGRDNKERLIGVPTRFLQ